MIALGWANIGAAVAPDAALAAVASAIILVQGGQGRAGVDTAIAVAIPIPSSAVAAALNSMPAWLTDGMSIGGGMVVAVGYAMVINMMATKEVWPFFAIGFCLAAVSDLTLIALGVIAVSMALIYLKLSENAGSGNGGSNTGDPLGDILNDY